MLLNISKKMKAKTKIAVFGLLLGSVVLIGVLHAVTPGYMILYHDTYRRLSYFPITIGAILFGIWGGVALAVASCLSFIPHLLMFWARGPEAYYSELSEVIFYLAAGLIVGLISTRERNSREKYKNLSEQLSVSYERLHEQAARLVKAEKQLGQSRKLSMLGQVSANMAHEIKNPLASIKGAAEILSEEVTQGHPKYEFIEIMRNEISRLNKSVEDVLKFCRGQQLKQKSHQESIETVVNKVMVMLQTAIKEKDISTSVNFQSDMVPFYVDEPAMTQVLVNVLINAVDAVDKQGKIIVEIKLVSDGCLILVSDNGPGIEDKLKQEVFRSFVTFKNGGTGIGLSISKKMVESLDGKISIENSSMGGARICILLPVNQARPGNGSIQDV